MQIRLRGAAVWTTIGMVAEPAVATVAAFPAAAFVPPSTVAATAVHGIRIRVPSSRADPVGISIQPAEFRTLPAGYGGHIPGRSAIVTDIPAGRAIFREFAPLVGDLVLLETGTRRTGLPEDWQPALSDVIIIECAEPEKAIASVVFENSRGGSVTVTGADGDSTRIGTVVQPVTGVGRFDGTSYTGAGAINTNHGGVITVSTAPESRPPDEGAPPESRGGFEIQPLQHARTQPGMTQAMIVAPLDSAGSLEGAAPLFSGVLSLGDGSPAVDIRLGDGPWMPMPEITGKVSDAFTGPGLVRLGIAPVGSPGVTAIRIRPEPREPGKLAALLAKLAIPGAPGESGGALQRVVWTLKMPYPPGASHAVFSLDGRTLAISNVRPFEVAVDVNARTSNLRADIVGPDGRALETRSAVVRAANGRLEIRERGS